MGNKAGPSFAEPGVVLSPVKLWVLAMLAPSRDCAWLRSRRQRRIWQGLHATADTMAGRDV